MSAEHRSAPAGDPEPESGNSRVGAAARGRRAPATASLADDSRLAIEIRGLVIPVLRPLYDYAWFVGFFGAGALYVVLKGGRSRAIA